MRMHICDFEEPGIINIIEKLGKNGIKTIDAWN